MQPCKLSVILPVYKDQKNLDRMVSELIINQPDDNWEVIIVDDGSTPPLLLDTKAPQNWQIVHNQKQRGAAVSRNKGAARAQGEDLVFLSVFLRIPPDYITRIRTLIQKQKFDFAQHLIKKAPDISATKFQSFLLDQEGRLARKEQVLPIKQSLFTAAIIKADVFKAVSGFDESMNHYGGHELDLIYRLDCAGYQNRVMIDAFSLERIKSEDQEIIRQRLVEYGQIGLPHLLEKHPELSRRILVNPGLWNLVFFTGVTRWLERWLGQKIEADVSLPVLVYRLYLHLLVRNAWADR